MNMPAAWSMEPAQSSRIERLAEIHFDALPTDFLPSLGQDFLESVYYPAALSSGHGITIIATLRGEPYGFVTVAHDANRFMSGVIRPNLLPISYYVARAILRRPRTGLEALALARATITARPDDVPGEIVFIAVDASQRGAGIGKALVQGALDYLAARQVSRCRTKTLEANHTVIGMYRQLGWTVRDRFKLIGRSYVTIVSPPIAVPAMGIYGASTA